MAKNVNNWNDLTLVESRSFVGLKKKLNEEITTPHDIVQLGFAPSGAPFILLRANGTAKPKKDKAPKPAPVVTAPAPVPTLPPEETGDDDDDDDEDDDQGTDQTPSQ